MPDIPQIIDSDANDGEVSMPLSIFIIDDDHPIYIQLFPQNIDSEMIIVDNAQLTYGQDFPRGDGAR